MRNTTKILSLTVLGLVLLAAAACSGSGGGSGAVMAPGQSQLNVVIHDETAPMLVKANVTFSSIEAHTVQGQWVPVNGTFPMTIDLLTLVNGKTFTLASGAVPAGTYDRIKLTIIGAQLELQDTTTVTITLPAGGVVVERPVAFTAVAGQPVTVTLDFRVDLSFKFNGVEFELEPEIEVESVEHED